MLLTFSTNALTDEYHLSVTIFGKRINVLNAVCSCPSNQLVWFNFVERKLSSSKSTLRVHAFVSSVCRGRRGEWAWASAPPTYCAVAAFDTQARNTALFPPQVEIDGSS